MTVKENDLDMIRITMKLLINAAYKRWKSEINWTQQDFEKWCNAYIDELLEAANIKSEESGSGCENGACAIHYKN